MNLAHDALLSAESQSRNIPPFGEGKVERKYTTNSISIVVIGDGPSFERSLIRERVRAGMRRAKLEGVRIGRRPAQFDREGVLRDRAHVRTLTEIAKDHRISRALVSKVLKQSKGESHKGSSQAPLEVHENTQSSRAA